MAFTQGENQPLRAARAAQPIKSLFDQNNPQRTLFDLVLSLHVLMADALTNSRPVLLSLGSVPKQA